MASKKFRLVRLDSIAVTRETRTAFGQRLERRPAVPLRCQIAPRACFRFIANGQFAILSFIAENRATAFPRHGIRGIFCRAVRQNRVLPRRKRQSPFACIDACVLPREKVDAAFGARSETQRRKRFLVQAEAVEIQRPFTVRTAIRDFQAAENRSRLMQLFLLVIRQAYMTQKPLIPMNANDLNRLFLSVRRFEQSGQNRIADRPAVLSNREFVAVCPQRNGIEISWHGKRLRRSQNE